MAEYRALRASVTRLWQKSLLNKPVPDTAIGDLIRFNEAIDQSINESVTSYSFEKKSSRCGCSIRFLSSLPDISFTLTLDGRFAYVNKALIELFALPPDKLVGKKISSTLVCLMEPNCSARLTKSSVPKKGTSWRNALYGAVRRMGIL
ncbi:PAS domain-containing protein [Undibacterium arcticum]